jgi:hypothetical protein
MPRVQGSAPICIGAKPDPGAKGEKFTERPHNLNPQKYPLGGISTRTAQTTQPPKMISLVIPHFRTSPSFESRVPHENCSAVEYTERIIVFSPLRFDKSGIRAGPRSKLRKIQKRRNADNYS